MPGLIRDFSVDKCGNGNIGTPQQTFCFAEGYNIALLGEKVTKTRYNSTMAQASPSTYISGKPVCRNGDKSADSISAAPGSSITFADDLTPPPGAFDVVDGGIEVDDGGIKVTDT